MAKYGEIVALLEYFDKKTVKPKGRSSKVKMNKEFDPVEYLTKERAKLERFEKYWKDQEKLNKKDDKKPEKNPLHLRGLEWFIIGILSYPFVGAAWQAMLAAPK